MKIGINDLSNYQSKETGNLASLIKIISNKHNVNTRDLLTQTLLHLPRLTNHQTEDQQIITDEISRLANKTNKERI